MIVLRFVTAAFFWMPTLPSAWAAEGNVANGQRLFGTCAACHSLEPNRNMTGPSLAELWNRKAGGLKSFPRYSPALELSGIIWGDKTLDEWLRDPQHLIPGNTMTFPGIKNAQQRADLLAFLKEAAKPGHAPTAADRGDQMGDMGSGMAGMMGGGAVPNLKTLPPEGRVQSIRYCGDTYKVTTADGKTRDFWERNLRLKTDSSSDGPTQGAPALVGAGMMGDRADVIFSAPEEIGGFISKC
jgi:cytochrome c